ncbi:MAG TPA: hypothetical protein ENH82_04255 [bacterium]|nr:hypothetical protein [bacterium]
MKDTKAAEEFLKELGREDEYLSAKIYVANKGFKFIKLSQLLTDFQDSEIERLTKIYEGKLNTKRIKAYRKLVELYRLHETTIATIFDAGADWIINHIKFKLKNNA